jgi:hypothetical protein
MQTLKREGIVLVSFFPPGIIDKVYSSAYELALTIKAEGEIAFLEFKLYLQKVKISLDYNSPDVDAELRRIWNEAREMVQKGYREVDLKLNLPIEFGGKILKRDGVDLYILGRTKGAKVTGGEGHYAGTLNIKEFEGVKVIRQGIPKHIQQQFPNSFEKQTKAYWEEINKPWLDEAIKSGADIRFIQDPRLEQNAVHILSDAQKKLEIFKNMKSHKTYLYFEYQYLLDKGYTLSENGLMVKKI